MINKKPEVTGAVFGNTASWAKLTDASVLNYLPIFNSVKAMAKNGKTGDGHRNGAVDNRTQFQHPNGHWIKRNPDTGRIMDVKHNEKPFKGVRKEK